MRAGLLAAVTIVAGFLASCGSSDSDSAAAPVPATGAAASGPGRAVPVAASPPVSVVARTFLPRPDGEDFVERIPLAEVGGEFVLQVMPRLITPHEGPWTVTFRHADGDTLARIPGQRVDVATGRLTLLARSDRFRAGDWEIVLTLDEGGQTAGAARRVWKFRVE